MSYLCYDLSFRTLYSGLQSARVNVHVRDVGGTGNDKCGHVDFVESSQRQLGRGIEIRIGTSELVILEGQVVWVCFQ